MKHRCAMKYHCGRAPLGGALAGLALLAGLAVRPSAHAQRADEPAARARYHEGARLYVQGQREAALQAVEAGLALAPDDARLRALRDLLRQEQPPGGGGPQPEEQPPDGPDREGEQPQDAPTPDVPAPEAPPARERAEAHTSQPPPGPMSREEADRILDAIAGDERLWLEEQRRHARPASPRSLRDW
ncbi:MAG: hypothetical protein ACK41D_10415 [Rubricoccaceae bacterium]